MKICENSEFTKQVSYGQFLFYKNNFLALLKDLSQVAVN